MRFDTTVLTAPSPMLLAVVAGALVLSALLGLFIGSRKDRPVLGFLLGGLIPVPGLLAIAVIPRKEPAYY